MRKFGINDLELLEMLFEQLPDSPFFIKNRELRYVAANQAMANLCGVRRGRDLYGKGAADFFPTELAQSYEALDRDVIATGRAVTDVLDRTFEAGHEQVWLLFARLPVRAADGSCIGVAATSRRLRASLGSDGNYERLRRVTDRLRRQFDRPLRLQRLAEEAGTSGSQLERDFRRIFAMTPRHFLHRIRMQEACRLLEDTDSGISAVAQDCGYSDQSAFTRRFVAEVGVSPMRYRRLKRMEARAGRRGSS